MALLLLGYFESLDDVDTAKQFIAYIANQARNLGAENSLALFRLVLVRAIACSHSHEDLPFTGEPHQPAYYPKLWEAAGLNRPKAICLISILR